VRHTGIPKERKFMLNDVEMMYEVNSDE